TGRDYRGGVTNPLLVNPAAGDFHIRSAAGRYDDCAGWTADAVTSWAVDKGNPLSAYGLEPDENGGRVNMGAYGNTEFASIGSTNPMVDCRVLNSPTVITATNKDWALVWSVLNVPTTLVMSVQFSGDGGVTWIDLATGKNAYDEYVLWSADPYYNTYKGLWRVIGTDGIVYADTNDAPFNLFFGTFDVSSLTRNGELYSIVWRGAWDEVYQVQQSEDGYTWSNSVDGAGAEQKANFLSTRGGDFTYEDIDASNSAFRLYRVIWDQY
ncbi:MAG: hypothetical protein JXB04_09295, partial [Kiritimatiellae bacterium]|nr:hypothetical protein [Kiritimatiellia bacterium]